MVRLQLLEVGFLVVALAAGGCGGSGGGHGNSGSVAPDITVSGTLAAGTVDLAAPSALRTTSRPGRASAPAGLQLYCVTLGKPSSSATASADTAGVVSLTLAAKGLPFGCFVLDALANGVATLTFSSASLVGQTITLSDSADLGTITVDSDSGVAAAGIPAVGAIVTTTPSGMACPIGLWSYETTSSAGTGHGTAWIAHLGSGKFVVSVNGVNARGFLRSFADVPATYAGSTFSIGPYSPLAGTSSVCATTKTATVNLTTVDSACTQMTGTVTRTGCNSPECDCETQTITISKR